MKLVPVRSVEAYADCEPDQPNCPPQATSTLNVATNVFPGRTFTFWIRMCWPEAVTLSDGCGAVVDVSTLSCGGTTTSADWSAVVLELSFATESCTVATVFPANTDVAAAPQVGAGVPLVAFWTQISNFVTAGGFAEPAGARTIGTNRRSASGSRCRQPHPSSGAHVRKLAHVSPPKAKPRPDPVCRRR